MLLKHSLTGAEIYDIRLQLQDTMWITSQSTATTKKSILKENGEGQENMPLQEAAKQICLKGVTTAHQPGDAAEKLQQGQKHTVRINTALEKTWGKLLHIF